MGKAVLAFQATSLLILVALCSACAPTQPPLPPTSSQTSAEVLQQNKTTQKPKTIPTVCAKANINKGADFALDVQVANTFNFVTNGYDPNGNYAAPSSAGTLASFASSYPNSYYVTALADMAAAFDAAPSYLEAPLCALAVKNAVFVDPNAGAPFAWSFWETSKPITQGNGTGRFVAIGGRYWVKSGIKLQDLETLIVQHLLGDNYSNVMTVAVHDQNESFATAMSNSNMVLMALLAREIGLMLYHDHLDPNSDAVSSPSLIKICQLPKSQSFQSYSWNSAKLANFSTATHIQTLGEETANYDVPFQRPITYLRPSAIRQLLNVFPNGAAGGYAAPSNAIATIYNGPSGGATIEWADPLAATTLYDDFAETFRLQALADAQTSAGATNYGISVTLSNTTATATTLDIIANLTKKGSTASTNSILYEKGQCIEENTSVWASP